MYSHVSSSGARLARSQTLFTTKSNKQAILNSLKQVALAGPANEQQRAVVTRVRRFEWALISARLRSPRRKSKRVKRVILFCSFAIIVCNSVLSTCTYPKQILSRNCTALVRISSPRSWWTNGSSRHFASPDRQMITMMMNSRYNSGRKRFTSIPIKHFSIQCDAIIIHNDFWQKKLLMHMNKRH